MRALATLGCGLALLAPAAAGGATGDPPANRTLSETTQQACGAGSTGQACQDAALADLNAARAAEGVGAMQLPADFGTLTVAQQLLVLSNLERVDRGLVPVIGLSGPLDQDALTGAQSDADPQPTQFNGNTWTANWEGGYGSPLEADFVWMYDDGYGSPNGDCNAPSDLGCWGHRHDILWALDSPAVMGAANATGRFGPSQTELFVGGDRATGPGQADAPLAPTWAAIAATLPFTVSPASLTFAPATTSAPLTVAVSGENMTISAVLPAAADGWSVTPATCAVNAGSSCAFTVATAPAAAGSATTLTLQGPNGAQQIPLAKPGAATLTTNSRTRTIAAGTTATITGTLLRAAGAGAPGMTVGLTQRAAGSSTSATVAQGTTTANGTVSFRVSPRVNTIYRLTFAGTASLAGASGAATQIDVAPRITAAFAHRSVPAGRSVLLSGQVTPGPGRHKLSLQVKRGHRWVRIASARADHAGYYHFKVRSRARGRTSYRVTLPATASHARGVSAARTLKAT